MSRSLGSVLGGAVARFLGGSLRGVVSRVIHTPGPPAWCGVTQRHCEPRRLHADSSGLQWWLSHHPRRRCRWRLPRRSCRLQQWRWTAAARSSVPLVRRARRLRVRRGLPVLEPPHSGADADRRLPLLVGVGELSGPLGCAPTPTSSSCRSALCTASVCSTGATALFFVGSGLLAAVIVN
jgi:hypothetical protein